MFVLASQIRIGSYTFERVNSVQVSRSTNAIGAKAVVKVPVSAVVKASDGTVSSRTETAKAVKAGDAVEIRLGYGREMNLEFKGYVRRINLKSPLEIECEDAFYLCRTRQVSLSGKSSTLDDILKACGLTVGQAATLTLKNFVADNLPASSVLEKLKADYGLHVFFDMDGKVYAIRAFDLVSETVRYEMRRNVIKDDELKYLKASEAKLKVKAVCFMADGSKVEATIGEDGGAEKTLYFYDVESWAELKTLAEAELRKYSKDGYEGTIETFLLPYAEPCMAADLIDPVYPERSGKYHITAVETSFGLSGARRKVSIGIAV